MLPQKFYCVKINIPGRVVAYYDECVPASFLVRWNWYYRYLAALLQVQFPFQEVAYNRFEVPQPSEDVMYQEEATRLYNKLVASKRTLTRVENALKAANSTENLLFAVAEQSQKYQATEIKLQALQQKHQEIIAELATIPQKPLPKVRLQETVVEQRIKILRYGESPQRITKIRFRMI